MVNNINLSCAHYKNICSDHSTVKNNVLVPCDQLCVFGSGYICVQFTTHTRIATRSSGYRQLRQSCRLSNHAFFIFVSLFVYIYVQITSRNLKQFLYNFSSVTGVGKNFNKKQKKNKITGDGHDLFSQFVRLNIVSTTWHDFILAG